MASRQLFLLFSALYSKALAGNPLVPGAGMADTNVHRIGNQFVIFATHDYSVHNTGFLMKDWWCWTSDDLVDWKLESVVQPNISVPWSTPGERDECWATDGAYRNGQYYFYLSVGGSSIGVVTSNSTQGPWSDPLGKQLLPNSQKLNPPTTFRDPAVFEDEDGSFYLIAGVFNYYIAKLNEDMISFAEPLRYVEVNEPYGPCGNGKTDDKPFLHKNEGKYYLSWGCFYAISDSVYGPYDTLGSVIATDKIIPAFRMNDTSSRPWYLHEDYTDRHGSFLQYGGQWYYASNDRSHSGDIGHEGAFRDTVMCYVHFRSNGTMEPCKIDALGVGSHDALYRIEAENFFILSNQSSRTMVRKKAEGGRKVDLITAGGGQGFAVAQLRNRSRLHYTRVMNLPGNSVMYLRIAAASQTPFTLIVSVQGDDADWLGSEVGRCTLPSNLTKDWSTYTVIQCPVHFGSKMIQTNMILSVQQERNVEEELEELARIDWIQFKPDA